MHKAIIFALALVLFPVAVSAQSTCMSLKEGDTGDGVRTLQQVLAEAYTNFPQPTGRFGATTTAALKQWQEEHGIEPIGIFGPKTSAAMKLCIPVPKPVPVEPPADTPIPTPQATSITRTLGPGSSGSDVARLQTFLVSQGLLASDATTGYYGALTRAAVEKWQQRNGLVASGTPQTTGFGVVGPRTLALLNQSLLPTVTGPIPSADAINALPRAGCSLGGKTLKDGESASFYNALSSLFPYACSTLLRTCNNGVLSGSPDYMYGSCALIYPTQNTYATSSCFLPGLTMRSGESATFYSAQTPPSGYQCSAISQVRTCVGGALTGDSYYPYRTCVQSSGNSCLFTNSPVASGASVTAYRESSVAAGSTCTSETRSCNAGSLSGSYQYATCRVEGSQSCSLDGVTVPHGSSRDFYSETTVPYGENCGRLFQSRTCTNGTLGGDAAYRYASCRANAAAPCTFDGLTIQSGESVTAYQNTSSSGSVCASQRRTCSAGTLSGSYQYSKCYPASSQASPPNIYVPRKVNGNTIQLAGWYTAPSSSGMSPTVILMHGCNGVNPGDPSSAWQQMSDWAVLFRSWGYGTLILDSFMGRDYPGGVCDNLSAVQSSDRAGDAIVAAQALLSKSTVAPRQFGVFGVSHGGNAAAYAVNAAFAQTERNAFTSAGGKISGSAALYPLCGSSVTDAHTNTAPFFLAIGTADDWSNPSACQTLANYPSGVRPAEIIAFGPISRIMIYEGAAHLYDINAPERIFFGHTLKYDAAATSDTRSRVKNFFDTYVKSATAIENDRLSNIANALSALEAAIRAFLMR